MALGTPRGIYTWSWARQGGYTHGSGHPKGGIHIELKAPPRIDSSPKALGELLTLPDVWEQFSKVSWRTVAPWCLNWLIHRLMEQKGSARLHTGATVLPKPWENCSLCPPSGDSSPSFLGELSPHGG